MDVILIFFASLVYLPYIFVQQPQFLFYLGVACLVSFWLHKVPAGFRIMASVATYFGLGLLGIAVFHSHNFHLEFQRPLFDFLFSLLPSTVVAFGVILLVQLVLSGVDQSEPASPIETTAPTQTHSPQPPGHTHPKVDHGPDADHPAPRPKIVRSESPSGLVAMIATFLLCGLVACAMLVRSV